MDDFNPTPKQKLMADLEVVIADAEELLKMTAGQAGDKAIEMRLRMQARMEQAKADLAHLQEVTTEKARDVGTAADDYVHDNPWQAIGVAAGAAFLLGLLISRS